MVMEKDHEFPWVEVDMETREMVCTACGEKGTTDDWLRFLSKHQFCGAKKNDTTNSDLQ
jgi:hypothetical protein